MSHERAKAEEKAEEKAAEKRRKSGGKAAEKRMKSGGQRREAEESGGKSVGVLTYLIKPEDSFGTNWSNTGEGNNNSNIWELSMFQTS